MGLVEVFAGWCLDRVNDIFFAKKDLSIESKTQLLHRYLRNMQSFYHRLDSMISPLLTWNVALPELQKLKESFEGILDEDIYYLNKQIFKEHFPRRRMGQPNITEIVDELEFFFEQKGFSQLSEQLKHHGLLMVVLHGSIKDTVSNIRKHLLHEDMESFRTDIEKLSGCKHDLNVLSSECKQFEEKLIDFARNGKS